MFKRLTAVFTLTLLALIPLLYLNQLAAGQETEDVSPIPPFIPGIPLVNNNEGRINATFSMLFGPDICTAYGDAFSPHNSPWAPGSYSYPYRIRIPADYPHDRVRVELFDPDSINRDENSDHIIFSDLAQSLNPTLFPPGTHLRTCSGNTNRKNACQILTGELTLVGSHRDLTIELVNPFWFVRVDENRGTSTPGQCGEPASYTPSRNTATLYELYYYAAAGNGSATRMDLAAYTGQTGDGIRDQGDHDTDLRWVSPGGPIKFDQPIFVPADSGSFVVDLNQDTPNLVVDPVTGERSLYLDVTALSGASENGFAIWAGPDHHVNVPSNINSRNLYLLNNPGAHDSAGVRVEAVDNLPNNINATMSLRMPLAELGPEYAGQTITVTHFDMDSGAKPPLIFHMDSLAFTPSTSWDGVNWTATDWALSFGGGAVDPDGRCFGGGASYTAACDNRWATPSYTLTLPTEQDCDYDNPTRQSCTPFYGGRLLATFRGGAKDSHVWQIGVPETPALDPSLGCSAFPIGVQEEVRSVLPPGQPGGANTWPTIYNYPNPGPVYAYFRHHRPDIPLLEAQPGDVFKVTNGAGAGQFAWLAWNLCRTSSDDLVESLAWPGNSRDYRPLPGDCTPGGFTPNVRGYVEPGDPADRAMHVEDLVAISSGVVNTAPLREQLNRHIDRGRILRLLVWDEATPPSSVKIALFALFEIVAYNLDANQNWLMLEFKGWDESCGQTEAEIAPVSLTLTGPVSGEVDVSYAITAVLSPTTSTPPLHYTWEASGHDPITYPGMTTQVQDFLWTEPGIKTITATLENAYGVVTATHTITINPPPPSLTLTPTCSNAGPHIPLRVEGQDWPVGTPIVLYWRGWYQSVITGHDGAFWQQWQVAYPGPGAHEVLAVAGEETATAVFTIPCTPQPLLDLQIEGPTIGQPGTSYTFTATISPDDATYPISYTWRINGQTPISQTNWLSDTLTIAWTTPGTKVIAVEATNAYTGAPLSQSHVIEILPWRLYLPFLVREP